MKYIKTYKESLLESDKWIDTGVKNKRSSWYRQEPEFDQKPSKVRIDDTVTYQILKFLYKKGGEGVRYTDIIKFIIEDIKKGKYDWKTDRGYWGTNLTSGTGILTKYATKNRSGKWVLDNPAIEKHFDELLTSGTLDQSHFYKRTGMTRDQFDSISDLLGIDKRDF